MLKFPDSYQGFDKIFDKKQMVEIVYFCEGCQKEHRIEISMLPFEKKYITCAFCGEKCMYTIENKGKFILDKKNG